MTLLLGIVCVLLAFGWWNERWHSEFWFKQWVRETQFCRRLLGIEQPKLRVIRGGKADG